MVRRKVFHPSLERLVELSAVDACDGGGLKAAADEFSRILQNLRLRGVWKWTGRHRLVRMDRLLSDLVAAEGWTSLRMLDIGASDGITSLDTVEHLRQANGMEVSLTMIDRDVRLLALRRGPFVLYATPSRRPILVRLGRLALCLEPMQGIEGVLCNGLAASLSRRCARWAEGAAATAPSIPLVNPAAAHCPSIEVRERDLFDRNPEWDGRFDVVRASNVLTLSYYTESRIGEALGVLHGYLREGGVLVISRNLIGERDETETGGLWRKRGPTFIRCAALEAVPEIAGLIDAFRAPSASCAPESP